MYSRAGGRALSLRWSHCESGAGRQLLVLTVLHVARRWLESLARAPRRTGTEWPPRLSLEDGRPWKATNGRQPPSSLASPCAVLMLEASVRHGGPSWSYAALMRVTNRVCSGVIIAKLGRFGTEGSEVRILSPRPKSSMNSALNWPSWSVEGLFCFPRCLKRLPQAARDPSGSITECRRWPVIGGCGWKSAAASAARSYAVLVLGRNPADPGVNAARDGASASFVERLP